MKSKPIRLAVVQINPVFGDVRGNVLRALALMDTAEADLFVLPELFTTGYSFLDSDEVGLLAEPADGPTGQLLGEYASRRNCCLAYGFAEKSDRYYNSAALVAPSGMVGLYRKVHLYDRENLIFAPGNLGLPVFELPFGNVGMMICFDWIYPECARTLARKGAEVIAHPANLVLPYCPDAMVTRCLENRVFAATADRVGKEDRGGYELTFIGRSEIVSPQGEVLQRLGATEEGVAIAEIDLAVARSKRINEFNDLLVGRREDQYR